jgi:hypothetical protein
VSYCRWGPDSDVYVYDDASGGTTCCACPLNNGSFNVATHAEMVNHLHEHIAAGWKVPDGVIDDLLATPDNEDEQ